MFVDELTTGPVVEETAPLLAVPMPESLDARSVGFTASFTAEDVLTTIDPRSLLRAEVGEPLSIQKMLKVNNSWFRKFTVGWQASSRSMRVSAPPQA